MVNKISGSRGDAMDAIVGEVAQIVRGTKHLLNANAAAWNEGMPPTAYVIMSQLVQRHPLSPAELIAQTGIDRSVVSRQLAALRRAGLLVSEPDPRDGRVSLFAPTADAVEQFDAARGASRLRLDAAFSDWPAAELATLSTVLAKFNRTIRNL